MLVLMSNVCYLAVIFLVVTARYLVLLLVTGGYCLSLVVPTFIMYGKNHSQHGKIHATQKNA